MIAPTATRVAEHTPRDLNERIRRQTEENIARYRAAGPEAMDRRLQELDHEWDIERVLETNASSLILLWLLLGTTVSRKWYALSAVVAGFLLQHAIQGWCPPIRLFRRLGYRTATEIEYERNALKAVRGDFQHLQPASR